MSQRIEYSEVLRMLKKCAKDFSVRKTDHKYRISLNGQFAHLPTKADEIYIQKVKKLVRDLGIDRKCAEKYLGFPVDVTPAN